MKKYVLNTAVLTIASLMAADASMASLEHYLSDLYSFNGAKVDTITGDIDLPGGTPGTGIDSESVKQILGTGSAVGTANLVDASTVSNRLLTVQLVADYDAFNFAAGALPADQSISAREVELGQLINAAFVLGNNLQTDGVTPVGAALGIGALPAVPGFPVDLLGAVAYSKNRMDSTAPNLGEAARNVHEAVGGVAFDPLNAGTTNALINIDTMRDALAVDLNNPATFSSIDLGRGAVNTALGAGGGAVAGKPFLTRLTGVDDADNTNPRLAGSLSGLLSIVPANDVMAQAEARRAALHAKILILDNGGAFNAPLVTSGLTFGGAAPGNAAAWNAVTAAPTSSLEAMIALL